MGYDVRDKTILVTGANRGIGKAILAAALERGAKKAYAAVRRLESAEPLVEEYGERVAPVLIDLEKPETIVAAARSAADAEIVVNNAGVLRTASPLSDDAVEAFEYEQKINVGGLIRMAQAFAPVLKANGGGVFVQLNSVASMKAFADFATYCASKAAAYSITQSLRDLLSEQGTQVISVHPGPIATDMANDAGMGEMAKPPSLVPEAIFAAMENGEFHAYPDSMAKQIGEAYAGFAKGVVEASLVE